MKKCLQNNLFLLLSLFTIFSAQSQGKISKELKSMLAQMTFIEGGTFNMGQTESDIIWNNEHDTMLLASLLVKRVTVSSFCISNREVSNKEWAEFYNAKVDELGKEAASVYKQDTSAWIKDFSYSYNEPMTQNYHHHEAFNQFPVVGVSWIQAKEYCKWKSAKVNAILRDAGLLGKDDPDIIQFRLPTEAEWEFAALALISKQSYTRDERIIDRRIYPWDGTSLKDKKGKHLANYGIVYDQNGVIRKYYQDDGSLYTSQHASYLANDYGLYDMAGNVAEWVEDTSSMRSIVDISVYDAEVQDQNPFRGDVVMHPKNSIDSSQIAAIIRERLISRANNTSIQLDPVKDKGMIDNVIKTTWHDIQTIVIHCDNKGHIVKGGSWADPSLYLMPGTRQSFPEDAQKCFIGFRVAMDRVDSNEDKNSLQSQLSKILKPKKAPKSKYR